MKKEYRIKREFGYTPEEIIPVVAELTEKYTGKESTSVSWNRARQLMGAVIYTIRECEESGTDKNNEKNVWEDYRMGSQNLIRRVERLRAKYDEMITTFCAYGNLNYKETVENAISGFFRYYDVKFCPQDSIITMDYPTIKTVEKRQGIHQMEEYLEYITLEQQFMLKMPEEMIYGVLEKYDPDYQDSYYNICRIVLRNLLGQMMEDAARRSIQKSGTKCTEPEGKKETDGQIDPSMIEYYVGQMGTNVEKMEEEISAMVADILKKHYNSSWQLFDYLREDIRDFCVELINAKENGCLQKIFYM